MDDGLHLLTHVIVLVVDLGRECAFAIVTVHGFDLGGNEALTGLKLLAVVVADDIAQTGLLRRGLHGGQMIESLVTLSCLGTLLGRHAQCELGSEQGGIDHLALSRAWMHAHSLYCNLGRGCVEILILQLADVAAIHRVAPLTAKAVDVEVVGSHTDFLIGIEGNADLAVLHLRMGLQPYHGFDDLGNAGFVVGAQQRRTVGNDEVLAFVEQQLRKSGGGEHHALMQLDVAAVVVVDDAWLDIATRGVRRRVVVADESDNGSIVGSVGRQCGVDVAILVHFDVLEPFVLQFFFQVAGKHKLLGG